MVSFQYNNCLETLPLTTITLETETQTQKSDGTHSVHDSHFVWTTKFI